MFEWYHMAAALAGLLLAISYTVQNNPSDMFELVICLLFIAAACCLFGWGAYPIVQAVIAGVC